MVYKKVECEEGPFIASDGSRYDIFEATKVMTPQGINVGWDIFDNINEAANAYGLICEDTDGIQAQIQQLVKEEINK